MTYSTTKSFFIIVLLLSLPAVVWTIDNFVIPANESQGEISQKKQIYPEETEAVSCVCPKCNNKNGEWRISYFSYPWQSQYYSVITTSERNLIWGPCSYIMENAANDRAQPITRDEPIEFKMTYTSTRSGNSIKEIQRELKIPNKGTVGGGGFGLNKWTMGQSGQWKYISRNKRECGVGVTIWDRIYYYNQKVIATRYRYNDHLKAYLWCNECSKYTSEQEFTDIYDYEQAEFVFPSGEIGVVALSSPNGADHRDSSFYSGLKTHYRDDTKRPILNYRPGKGLKTIDKWTW